MSDTETVADLYHASREDDDGESMTDLYVASTGGDGR